MKKKCLCLLTLCLSTSYAFADTSPVVSNEEPTSSQEVVTSLACDQEPAEASVEKTPLAQSEVVAILAQCGTCECSSCDGSSCAPPSTEQPAETAVATNNVPEDEVRILPYPPVA